MNDDSIQTAPAQQHSDSAMIAAAKPLDRRRKARKRRSTNVPGQFLGYSLQVTRLTHLLVKAEAGSRGSLEVLDDVGVQDADGATTAVQTKSALTGNPLSDGSSVLWKTLANWADAVATGALPSGKLHLVMYVSKPVSGPIAEKLAAAKDEDAVKIAIEDIQKHFRASPLPVDSPALSHFQRFFAHQPATLERVVQSLRIEYGSGSPQADLEAALDNCFFKEGRARQLAVIAQGWVKRRVDEMLEKGNPAVIERDGFFREMQAFHTKFVERSILQSFAEDPSEQEVQAHRAKTYVRQLEIIDADFEEKMAAISHYFKAASDRTNWGASGMVQEDSFNELDSNLISTWRHHRKRITIRDGQRPASEQGQLLLVECMGHVAPVENLQAPPHFIPGCFHVLSDKLEIGWHPDYQGELGEPNQGGGN